MPASGPNVADVDPAHAEDVLPATGAGPVRRDGRFCRPPQGRGGDPVPCPGITTRIPRPTTRGVETMITSAIPLERHAGSRWPKATLRTQPADCAVDLCAHLGDDLRSEHTARKVKTSARRRATSSRPCAGSRRCRPTMRSTLRGRNAYRTVTARRAPVLRAIGPGRHDAASATSLHDDGANDFGARLLYRPSDGPGDGGQSTGGTP